MATRIQIAKQDIIKTFEELPRILRSADVAKTFEKNRAFWRLAKSSSLRNFTEFLVEKTALKPVRFGFPQREVSGYTWGNVPLLEVLLGLVDNSYYSHYTAVRLHGLTEQVPKTVYLNQEKLSASTNYSTHPELFSQDAIDGAFQKSPRVSQNEAVNEDIRIIFLSSAYKAMLGVTTETVNYGEDHDLLLRFTNLERTLIDIVVRPFYSGGVFEVAKVFENAKDQVSVNRLKAMLKQMAFGYPYHQAIGFYLERAGYKQSQIDMFKNLPMERDFYLTHAMGKTSYLNRWRLHIPEGF